MAMIKKSNKNIPCTLCSDDALTDSDPPLCKKHAEKGMHKKAKQKTRKTLKELHSAD